MTDQQRGYWRMPADPRRQQQPTGRSAEEPPWFDDGYLAYEPGPDEPPWDRPLDLWPIEGDAEYDDWGSVAPSQPRANYPAPAPRSVAYPEPTTAPYAAGLRESAASPEPDRAPFTRPAQTYGYDMTDPADPYDEFAPLADDLSRAQAEREAVHAVQQQASQHQAASWRRAPANAVTRPTPSANSVFGDLFGETRSSIASRDTPSTTAAQAAPAPTVPSREEPAAGPSPEPSLTEVEDEAPDWPPTDLAPKPWASVGKAPAPWTATRQPETPTRPVAPWSAPVHRQSPTPPPARAQATPQQLRLAEQAYPQQRPLWRPQVHGHQATTTVPAETSSTIAPTPLPTPAFSPDEDRAPTPTAAADEASVAPASASPPATEPAAAVATDDTAKAKEEGPSTISTLFWTVMTGALVLALVLAFLHFLTGVFG